MMRIQQYARPLAALSLLVATACTTKQDLGEIDDTGTDSSTADTGEGDTGGDSGTSAGEGEGDSGGEDTGPPPPPPTNPGPFSSVSVLLVIDNSGSMAEEQGLVAPAVSELADDLTAAGVDWRVGVTTTDLGNPWCDGTGPENGRLVLASCREHLDDFIFNGAEMIDAQDTCTSICPQEWASIQTTPTTIASSAQALPRPWVQSVGGVTNLPPGLSPGQAMQCLVPQGIAGCGFEQPLEAVHRAADRFIEVGDGAEGFLPPDALLAVVVVTDEADCSQNPDHHTMFLPDGNRVFWSNPEGGAPTSAVCWNAGVECNGTDCHSADHDENGALVGPAQAETDAVLPPVSRYVARLQAIGPVLFNLIGGATGSGDVIYGQPGDPDYLMNFGTGPGCTGINGNAVPPVRMREVADVFADGTDNIFSVCASNYSTAMSDLAATLAARVQ